MINNFLLKPVIKITPNIQENPTFICKLNLFIKITLFLNEYLLVWTLKWDWKQQILGLKKESSCTKNNNQLF